MLELTVSHLKVISNSRSRGTRSSRIQSNCSHTEPSSYL